MSSSFTSFEKLPKSSLKIDITKMTAQLDHVEKRREKRKHQDISEILSKARKKINSFTLTEEQTLTTNITHTRSPPTSTK